MIRRCCLTFFILASNFLSGCQTITPFAVSSHLQSTGNEQSLLDEINQLDLAFMRDQIANTKIGTLVGIHAGLDHRYLGTLVGHGQKGVELMNSLCQETVPAPDGEWQSKMSHIPFQTLEIPSITHFVVVVPAPKDFAKTNREPDTSDLSIHAIVFKDGYQEQLESWSESSVTVPDADPSNDTIQNLAVVPSGSRVKLVNEFDQQMTATLLRAGAEEVKLMNCVWKEKIPGPQGRSQYQTTHLPLQVLKTTSIKSFRMISPPLPHEMNPEFDASCLRSVAEFVYQSGRKQRWGKPIERL